MIVGIGTDIVGVRRFERLLERTPRMLDRLFTEAERRTRKGELRRPSSLAVRFAAKEAVVKALGAPHGYQLLECEVVAAPDNRPSVRLTGVLADAAEAAGVGSWHVSLTHDADIAAAFVVAERSGRN
ncbi:holo-ACP synthase [Allokutzneria albata]|uniref:Holo-[acyl-carrier-protein] synthase n=1 Tax=Allokutzneria albata TaxID=211114 RepID=A0A1G9YWI2_ALLAB|nr:holo-ACP synthase [Allokutzneria albata]SDN13474.1 holo-[acyl-carrier protein] synthase [Allokutzneria albata]